MAAESATFTNAEGATLKGYLHLPTDGPPRAGAVFAHCFTCGANIKAAVHVSQALADEGFAVLRFDFTGLGASEGDFADSNFSSNVGDLIAAAEFLQTTAPVELMVGHSLGGAAVLAAAPNLDTVRAVATIGAPAEPVHVAKLLAEGREEIEREGSATVQLGGRPFRVKRQFLEDLDQHELAKELPNLKRALLVMHSPMDTIVGIDNASGIFSAAKHPKSFVSLNNADHLLSRPEDARYAAQTLAAWASRYVTAAQGEPLPDGVVATTGAGAFLTQLAVDGHAMIADEPASVGGSNQGPTPYGYLSAALASCTSMTLQMYAKHKGLPLEAAKVRVTHSRIHAEDCDHCETKEGRIDRFTRDIELVGPLDEKTRARMLEIADRCPVHRTLEGEIDIVSNLAG